VIRKKILLLGDFGVGKTSLIRRYVDRTFDDRYLSTIGVKISRKQISLENELYELLIWDIEGETPVRAIPKSYMKGAAGAIFVADVSRSHTIDDLDRHIQRFNEINPGAPHVLAYNKCDLLDEKRIQKIVQGSDALPVSAKTDYNVEKLFESLVRRIVQ